MHFLKAPGFYKPGGTSVLRLRNLILLHLATPLVVLWHFLATWLAGERLVLLATTSPPLIQWTCILSGWGLRVPVVLWLQDAHPEVEARALVRMNLKPLAAFLRMLDRQMAGLCSGLIPLDEAMCEDYVRRTGFQGPIQTVPPWGTYLLPAKNFRAPSTRLPLKILYAGNYGSVHDLAPLAAALGQFSASNQANICLTFVGMSESGLARLRALFSGLRCQLNYLPRLAALTDLVGLMATFDLGVVSLAAGQAGVACPSKAFSYLSQGLPVLYVGPEHTLTWNLCKAGWGYTVDDLLKLNQGRNLPVSARVGEVFPDPGVTARQAIYDLIEDVGRANLSTCPAEVPPDVQHP